MHSPTEDATAASSSVKRIADSPVESNKGATPRIVGAAVFCVVWLLSVLYLMDVLDWGWVPHDEGAFGQSAERVLRGQLPHRDFIEIYTGGLSYLHALAFELWGTNLVSLRLMLFVFFIAWVPATFYVASRFVPPLAAGVVTLLAVAWSTPMYPAAVPSWYNLFFAVFGAAALLRFLETEHRRWLVLAGACGGLSLLVKVVGLYFVAAALLFLVFHEQGRSRPSSSAHERSTTYSAILVVGLTVFVLLLFGLVWRHLGAREITHFVLPGIGLAALLIANEFSGATAGTGARLTSLRRLVLPFLAGVTIPVAAFVLPYVVAGALPELLNGVFVLPAKRLASAAMQLPRLRGGSVALWLLTLAIVAPWIDRRLTPLRAAAVGTALITLLVQMSRDHHLYQAVWKSVRLLVPITSVAAAVILWLLRADDAGRLRREGIFLLVSVTALGSLVQFPFSAPIYFCYVAPLLVLAVTALLSARGRATGPVALMACGFFLAFAVFLVRPGFIYAMGVQYRADYHVARLDLPRGGLRVSEKDSELYRAVIEAVHRHAHGRPIYVTPDAPEIYFLSASPNPTPTIFDFFDESAGRSTRILNALERNHVNVVVLNARPSFSEPLSDPLLSALRHLYPYSRTYERFEVRWRQ